MDQDTFKAGLDLLKNEDPQNIMIERFESQGYSFMNWQIMKVQLNKLQSTIEQRKQKSKALDPVPQVVKSTDQDKAEDDKILDEAFRQRRNLFAKRAKLSNEFHQVKTIKARSTISDKIHSVQKAIRKLLIQIEDYKKDGTVPDLLNDKFAIPENDLDKWKLRKNLMTRVSNKKKHIRDLFNDPAISEENKKARIAKAEDKLSYLKTYLNHVNKAVGK